MPKNIRVKVDNLVIKFQPMRIFFTLVAGLGLITRIAAQEAQTTDTIRSQNIPQVELLKKQGMVQMKGDKTIYDVEKMGISTGNNGLETIRLLPGFSLDQNENIVFRGSAGIQIMINGRKSLFHGNALKEYIRNLRGEDIARIEVISQPSARYEATGTTGIVNIVLKANKNKGFGGTISGGPKFGKYFKYAAGATGYYNDTLWAVNAGFNHSNGKSFNDRNIDQHIVLDSGDQRELLQHNYWLPKTTSYNGNLAIQRRLDKNQTLSTSWQASRMNSAVKTTGTSQDIFNDILQEEVALLQNGDEKTKQVSGNLFYNYTSDSLTTKLDLQLNYGYYNDQVADFQQNRYKTGEVNELDGQKNTKYNLFNAQADLKQRLAHHLTLETGVKASVTRMDYFNHYKKAEGKDFLIPDSLLTNDFNYRENLISAYAQADYEHADWSFTAGLRMENTNYKALSEINHERNARNYVNWFPSVSINYKHRKHQYRISYSRRVSRPDYLDLNPYYEYLDAYNIERGNPELKPQFYDSFELDYIYRQAFNVSLYGFLYKNGFVSVTDYQKVDNFNVIYNSNASKGSRLGLTISTPMKLNDWWTVRFNLDAYLSSEQSKIPDYTYDGKGSGYELNIYQQFEFPKDWSFSLIGYFVGRTQTPTGHQPSLFDLSASVKKYFFDKNLQVALSSSQFLKNAKYDAWSTVNQVQTHCVNRWETGAVNLSILYRFGTSPKKTIKSTSLEEKNRI